MFDISPAALEVLHGHLSTQMRWSVVVDDVRYYRDERIALHRQISRALLADTTKRDSPRALVLAGGPASGKNWILGTLDVPPRAVHLDADAIKELLPEYQELLELGDEQAAYVVHEESADIARRVLSDTIARRRHLVLSAVGDSKPGKFVAKLKALAAHGFQLHVVYVDVDVDEAVRRAAGRQRIVPEEVVRMLHREVAARFTEVEALDLSSLRLFATDDGTACLIAERQPDGWLAVYHPARLESFRQKAQT